jgi:hypothetical protein
MKKISCDAIIHSKWSNFLLDVVNNIDTPTTHWLQGVPRYRTIAIKG